VQIDGVLDSDGYPAVAEAFLDFKVAGVEVRY
jgi:hypothetical protein